MVNRVIIIGRLGQDPEVKQTQSGNVVCNFTVATSERWKDKSGEQKEKTEWIRIVVWGSLAEICGKYLTKGSLVYLEGKLQTRSYEDKDKSTRYITEVLADSMRMLGDKKDSAPNQDAGEGDLDPAMFGPG